VQSGRLRHRVSIQQRGGTFDAGGGVTWAWTTIATVWAEVRTPAGFEQLAAEIAQQRATVTHTVRIRGGVAVEPSMRILWGTRVLEIVSVTDPDNRGESQVLLCTEIIGFSG